MREGNTFPRLADNLALDFLNTLSMRDAELSEMLRRDEDVQRWLAETSLIAEVEHAGNPKTMGRPEAFLHRRRCLPTLNNFRQRLY